MSLPASAGGRYRFLNAPPLAGDQGVTGQEVDTPPPPMLYPYDDLPVDLPPEDLPMPARPAPRLPYDNVEPIDTPRTPGRGFQLEPNANPDGADIGPQYISPQGARWIEENLWDQGLSADIGLGVIIGPDGQVVGELPKFIPRMM